MNKLTFGTDPEVFSVVEKDEKPFVISPALLQTFKGLRPVKRDYKHPIFLKEGDFSWMMDGVAWEATYLRPFSTAEDMHNTIKNSLIVLEEFLSNQDWQGEKLKIYRRPVVNIDPDLYVRFMDNEEIYQGFIFGCDRDWDAIESEYECKTFDVFSHGLRYGGGHFHIGSEDPEERELIGSDKTIIPMVQLLSILVGNVCIKNSPYPEEEKLRSFHYGKPGRFRPQKWGVEYRTPSNSWIGNLDTLEEMMSGASKALYFLQRPEKAITFIRENLPNTVKAITTADQELAKYILETAK